MTTADTTPPSDHEALQAMAEHGGEFASNLAEAWLRADRWPI